MSADPMSDPAPDADLNNEDPPGAWRGFRAVARRVVSPVERFLAVEAASGVVLLAAAALALGLANSPWRAGFAALWHLTLGVRVGALVFQRDLHFWVNDGLMTIFFFVVGLEIRRELSGGELSDLRRAALPILGAVGGMVAPALLYLAFNAGHPTAGGWGIPMATDIAFAVGVLALLGPRVPSSLRILLLTLAVIDDVGAILVIAAFYSESIAPVGLAIAAGGVAGIWLLQKLGARHALTYLAPALLVWAGAYRAGVHPTLAGVLVGLMTPVRAWFGPSRFVSKATEALRIVSREEEQAHAGPLDADGSHRHGGHGVRIGQALAQLDAARREALSPLDRLQAALHGPVAFVVMPLFALANAGVPLGTAAFDGSGRRVLAGVIVGLAVGKPAGIVGLSLLAAKLGLVRLPDAVGVRGLAVLGLVGGIGFTMALFIAALAFPGGAALETAKLGILAASALAAITGLVVGRLLLPRPPG